LLRGEPVLFDALEFDEDMASIDVLYDLAYLIMDLWERGLSQTANSLLNHYLWRTDEANLAGLAALPLFLSVRAAIRAKVVAATLPYRAEQQRDQGALEAKRYFALAEGFLAPSSPRLVAIGGLSGAGKTTIAAELAPHIGRAPGSVHLRSDIERKRLFGVEPSERLPPVDYRSGVSVGVYAEMRRKAALALVSSFSVIADAVHARSDDRAAIAGAALAVGVPFDGLWLNVPLAQRIERVEGRRDDASDATADVARRQADINLGDLSWRRIAADGDASSTICAALRALGINDESTPGGPAPGGSR
jgi:uncharacterized protein